MLEISNEGAKVLHNRCVEVGQKYNIPIITKSTFNDNSGSIINDKIEETQVKSIVKNDNISRLTIIGYGIINNNSILKQVIDLIEEENLKIINIEITSSKIAIVFNTKISDYILEKFHKKLIK